VILLFDEELLFSIDHSTTDVMMVTPFAVLLKVFFWYILTLLLFYLILYFPSCWPFPGTLFYSTTDVTVLFDCWFWYYLRWWYLLLCYYLLVFDITWYLMLHHCDTYMIYIVIHCSILCYVMLHCVDTLVNTSICSVYHFLLLLLLILEFHWWRWLLIDYCILWLLLLMKYYYSIIIILLLLSDIILLIFISIEVTSLQFIHCVMIRYDIDNAISIIY